MSQASKLACSFGEYRGQRAKGESADNEPGAATEALNEFFIK